MKKNILIFVIIIYSVLKLFVNSALANGIAFANVQDIFETSSLGKSKVISDKEKFKPEINKLKQNINILQNKIDKIIKEKNNLKNDNNVNKKDSKIILDKIKNKDKEQQRYELDLKKCIKEYESLIVKVQKVSSNDADIFKNALIRSSLKVIKEKQLDAILPSEISLYNIENVDVTKDILKNML